MQADMAPAMISARIRLDLGVSIVTRTFKKSETGGVTTKISVESAEGEMFTPIFSGHVG